MNRHSLPKLSAHPFDAAATNEIRYPVGSNRHNARPREEGRP